MRTPLLLDIAADACPERLALGNRDSGHDFDSYRARATRVAAWLIGKGKANTAFLGMNSSVLPVVLFASGMAGTPFVPLNYRLSDAELNKLVARAAPAVLVVDDEMIGRILPVDGIELIARSELEAAFMTGSAPEKVELPEAENDIAVLLFTSGTTGEPKAAVLRHANLTSYVMSTVEFLGADEEEAALVSVPSYHIAGISAILTAAYGGRRIVYLPAFTAEAWVATAAAEGITHAMVVPTMLDRILDVMEKTGETLPSLQALSYGGGKMPEPVIARALALLPHVAFVNAYGLTETSSTIALLGAEDHRAAFASDDPVVRRRIASVGQPLPTIELEIRRDDGTPCGPGEQGEIHVRTRRRSMTTGGSPPMTRAGSMRAGICLSTGGSTM
jgi:fatty-acyl-CoA synthase